MTTFAENLRGISALVACNALFLGNDTLIKLASRSLPLGEILLLRGAFAALVLTPFIVATGQHRQLALAANWPMFWRTVAEIVSAALYLLALFHIPLANINAILQTVPLMLTAAGALFLGETVGWRRWTAIGIGFAGVLIVIRPGFAGFNAYSLLALGSVFFIALRDVCSRIMPRGLTAMLVAFITAIAVGLSGPAVGLALDEVWVAPDGEGLLLIAGAVFFLIGGYLTSVIFMRHGDISVVAPFRYTAIVWAMLIGYFVFADIPEWPMLAGTAIVIATGVYTLYRERRVAALRAEAAAGEGV
ncbi:MAG TPA: DMT family transporter [Bauldia sp.]|nr:DMT family transporter [Bauldia sp.]